MQNPCADKLFLTNCYGGSDRVDAVLGDLESQPKNNLKPSAGQIRGKLNRGRVWANIHCLVVRAQCSSGW